MSKALLSSHSSLRLDFSPEQSSFWDQLPSQPGIYIFEDEDDKPLYIGKSIDLGTRIKQHYEGYSTGTTKAQNFIPKTKTLYLKVVKNDLEAVIMEANYIRSYLPRYNSAVKDDKSNVYIVFTNPPDTKIKVIHATDIRTLDLDDYKKQVWGPYTSSRVANTIIKEARRIFGFCLAPFNARSRECFNYHLNHCPGACNEQITISEYQKHLGKIKSFLSGKFVMLKKRLKKQILKASSKQEYEKAGSLKWQLESLEQSLTTKNSSLLLMLSDANDQLLPLIVSTLNHPGLKKPPRRIECYDLAHLQGESYVGSMVVFENCSAITRNYRHFKINLPDKSDPHAMRQIIERRLNHPEWSKPDLIVLDGGLPQLSTVSKIVPADIPIIALAKKRETLMFYGYDGKVVSLDLGIDDPVLNLFRSIRDEAHRFANSYHLLLRSKKLVSED